MGGRIEPLLSKLESVCDIDAKVFSGDKEREFFIEEFPASSVDDLLDQHTPEPHNPEWEMEWQKASPDPDAIMKPRRAIAFMVSGRGGIYRRYKETELRAFVNGRARMIRHRQMLRQTEHFVKMKSYRKA